MVPKIHNENMEINSLIFPFFLFSLIGLVAPDPNTSGDHVFINCGSAEASIAIGGREWLGDACPKLSSAVEIQGSSTRSILSTELMTSVDLVYRTSRISRSRFSYNFQLPPGQKFILLHFYPTSYNGFLKFNDLFTVEAGPFTLLANFSASITAEALAVDTFAKEFCLIAQENQPLTIVFTPATKDCYAFINGIEIISVPSSLSYGGDVGLQVVGQRFLFYIDDFTALEMVHRQNIRRDSFFSSDDIRGTFQIWATILKQKANKVNDMSWRISVDVGFRYMIRIHFCVPGLRMAENGNKDFILLINNMTASSSADVFNGRADKDLVWYKNYMVVVKGHRQEGKRDIFISLHSEQEFVDGFGPLEGFEIFKLSSDENSLAGPSPLHTITQESSPWTFQILHSVLSQRNVTTVGLAIICLVSIVVHTLQKNWGTNCTKEENEPSARAKRICRHFSLSEIQSATENFFDAYVIGKGGFGKVYKGLIDNGEEIVAIKQLKSNSKQGKREFWAEVEMLSELKHLNILPLIGYCNEQGKMILVYEYMPCGTLADHLYRLARKNTAYHPLSWKQRLKICIGAGRGLDYLHTGNGIIHRDIKTSNILLNEKLVAKISDFGLAKTESDSESQRQASTNLKGTFGYVDPDFLRTHRFTRKSDTYSFGVVLLEVLCGRPAVEHGFEEEKRRLTVWALNNISEGGADLIVAPSLRGEISPESLETFVTVVERCLFDDPKERPEIADVVTELKLALEQQEKAESSAPREILSVADVYQINDKNIISSMPNVADKVLPQKENVGSSVPNDADVVPGADITYRQETAEFPSPNVKTSVTDALPVNKTTVLSAAFSNLQNLIKKKKGKMVDSGQKDERKSAINKLSRTFFQWGAVRNTRKSSKNEDIVTNSLSAPVLRGTRGMIFREVTIPEETTGSNDMTCGPNFRVFTYSELRAATRNFRPDAVVGAGGFGTVYKGWLNEKSSINNGSRTQVAIKKLNPESMQGLHEWQSEVRFLGRLSHPNLVKLLGYCCEDKELLLVYEFLQNGSLEDNLFQRHREPIPWDIRLKILIGTARGMAFLHALDKEVIYRDFKPSNILLDSSYHAKLTDFGLARVGPADDHSHVSTGVKGTYGYAAPEYMATGHLYVKSDVYSFGVVLLEMLTGLRVNDKNRPSGQQNLVEWIKPLLCHKRKLKGVFDPRLQERYPRQSVTEIAKLAQNCLEPDPKGRPSMQEVVEALEKTSLAAA